MMKSVLIVGVGNIGSRLYREYSLLSPDRYDPFKGIGLVHPNYKISHCRFLLIIVLRKRT